MGYDRDKSKNVQKDGYIRKIVFSRPFFTENDRFWLKIENFSKNLKNYLNS